MRAQALDALAALEADLSATVAYTLALPPPGAEHAESPARARDAFVSDESVASVKAGAAGSS